MAFFANRTGSKKVEDSRKLVTSSGAWVSEDRNRYNKDSYVSRDEVTMLRNQADQLSAEEEATIRAMFD